MRCVCPKAAAITAIPAADCPLKLDQIVRLGFQRIQPGNASTFPAATAEITDIASWDALKTAVGGTKIQFSPYFDSLVIPQSEGLEEGGNDNSTAFGIPIDLGEGAVKVTGQFRNLPVAVKKALDAYRCESQSALGQAALGIYAINQYGEIIHNVNGTDPVAIPIYNFRLSSRGSEGFNASDKIGFSFYLPAGWDNDLAVTKPDFNALLEL